MTIKAVVFDAYGTLYDIQSVAAVTEEAFPGYGEIVTQVWRIKQLEYTWLRSLMRRYEDFSVITRDSLAYTLRCLGLKHDPAAFERREDWLKPHLNLGVVNRNQLQRAGLKPEQIELTTLCTQCRADLFFSYRREGERAGRMLSVIGIAP